MHVSMSTATDLHGSGIQCSGGVNLWPEEKGEYLSPAILDYASAHGDAM